jgi:hypothetical protein
VTDLATANPNPLPKGPPKVGPAPPPQTLENWKKYNDVAREKDATAGQTLNSANAAVQDANNAQIALKAGAWSGPVSSKAAMIQTFLGNPSATRGILGNAASRQVMEKVLGNAALLKLEEEAKGGGGIRMGAQMVGWSNKLAASADMSAAAIQAMTDAAKANAAYERQKYGPDYAAYKKAGGDVNSFERVYGDKFPNQNVVNENTLTGNKYTPEQVAAYAAKHADALKAAGVTAEQHLGISK